MTVLAKAGSNLACRPTDRLRLLVLNLGRNKCSAYIERPILLLVEEEAPLLYIYMFRREQESWSWISKRPEDRNDCAGEDQQQFNRPTVVLK
jgi:hypothetical protein